MSAHDDENICKWSLDGNFLGENPTTIKAVYSILTLYDFNKSVIFSPYFLFSMDFYYRL